MVWQTIFWILLILTGISVLVPDSVSPYLTRGRFVVVLILIAILGFYAIPIHK